MSQLDLDFIGSELREVKEKCTLHVNQSELVTCVPSLVRVHLKKTAHKQLAVCLQFPENYPQAHVLIELKSKTLSDKLLDGLQKIAEHEAEKSLGKQQVLPVLKFIQRFIEDNPLCVCSEEISFIKKELLEDCDVLKLKQKASQIVLKLKKNEYKLRLKLFVPDSYPLEQVSIEVTDHSFPELLQKNFFQQSIEIARRCVKPPMKKKPKDPPFEPRPSLQPVCTFLIKDCIKRYPSELCPICQHRALTNDPKNMPTDPKDPKNIARVYCGHVFHYDCLDKYMKTPPFIGGKMCPSCSKRIFHEEWSATPELAENRWAHQEARHRELSEVVDFFE